MSVYCVSMIDIMLSDYGPAKDKIHRLVIECYSQAQADYVAKYAALNDRYEKVQALRLRALPKTNDKQYVVRKDANELESSWFA